MFLTCYFIIKNCIFKKHNSLILILYNKIWVKNDQYLLAENGYSNIYNYLINIIILPSFFYAGLPSILKPPF